MMDIDHIAEINRSDRSIKEKVEKASTSVEPEVSEVESTKTQARDVIRQARVVYEAKKKRGFKNKGEQAKAETLAQLVLALDHVIKSMDKNGK
ncbi:hypothetical protein FKG94_22605 [Exilibacterium tricleocarpae]|uniref:Uncharacterized protein n=1 Tax=Exilibacterium tricleocarpae TaxID=2591008 RepID=A0A545SY97_9GAMM|nr:hypothetical protein [Exilibacterium tricleocarpae]TQV69946.1 hypothetical protein FKG94_22605 [Exilibacterium tricleocarpae]